MGSKAKALKVVGKQPAIPEYEKVVRDLERIVEIDDAKMWVDKSDALAAWARVYRRNDVGRLAKQLRLHAFRRMGRLALDLAPPHKPVPGGGSKPGPVALLKEHGISNTNAKAAVALAKLGKGKFDRQVEKDKPLAPATIERRMYPESPLSTFRSHQRTPFSCATFIREVSPRHAARKIPKHQKAEARAQMERLQQWVTDFLMELGK